MKKKILGGVLVLVIVAIMSFNITHETNNNNFSFLSLENIEALAGENDDRSRCSTEWFANVMGQTVKLSCSADCPSGQRAQCKQNNCKCV